MLASYHWNLIYYAPSFTKHVSIVIEHITPSRFSFISHWTYKSAMLYSLNFLKCFWIVLELYLLNAIVQNLKILQYKNHAWKMTHFFSIESYILLAFINIFTLNRKFHYLFEIKIFIFFIWFYDLNQNK